jgi:flagellar biosynthesis protein FlhG
MNGIVDTQAKGLAKLIPQPPRAPWVAVTGAKGGVGKTLLSVNLALLLARAGHRTLLVDLDAGCGDVEVHLRLGSRHTVEDLALGACAPAAALVQGPAGLLVLAGRSGSPLLASGDAALLERAFAGIRAAAAAADVVVCDTGAGIGPATLGTAERADLVLAVTTPDPASLTDTYALCKVLHTRGRPMPRLVVNRVRSRDEAMRTAGKLTTVARKFLQTEVALLGFVQQDGLLELSAAEQRPFALHGQGPAREDLRGLCAAVLGALPAIGRRIVRAEVRAACLPASGLGRR